MSSGLFLLLVSVLASSASADPEANLPHGIAIQIHPNQNATVELSPCRSFDGLCWAGEMARRAKEAALIKAGSLKEEAVLEPYRFEPGQYVICKTIERDQCEIEVSRDGKRLDKMYFKIDWKQMGAPPRTANIQAHLGLEGSAVTTAYTEPGHVAEECKNDREHKLCDSWPNRDAAIHIRDSVLRVIHNPLTDEDEWELFYQVQGLYRPPQNSKDGVVTYRIIEDRWIPSRHIKSGPIPRRRRPAKPPVPKPVKSGSVAKTAARAKGKPAEDCPPARDPRPLSEKAHRETVRPALEAVKKKWPAPTEVAEAPVPKSGDLMKGILSQVGACLLVRDAKGRGTLPKIKGKTTENPVFVHTMLPAWEKKSIRKMIGPDGAPVTKDQLLAIDTFARTLFTEQEGCFRWGRRFPMAVAKAAMVRSYRPERFGWTYGMPDPKVVPAKHRAVLDRLPIVGALVSPNQFSVWNNNARKSLKKGLCPPRSESDPIANGKPPSRELVSIWEESVRIASEAVLTPDDFARRTSDVNAEYYTSKIDFLTHACRDYTQEVSIDGLPLDVPSCVRLWRCGK